MSYDRDSARSLPGCVAQTPEDVTWYRGYDHRHCGHPTDPNGRHRPGAGHTTPTPAGYRRCAGDPGCQFRLTGTARLCPFHQDAVWSLPGERYEELMGAKPPKPIRVPA